MNTLESGYVTVVRSWLSILVACVLISACATSGHPRGAKLQDTGLFDWIDRELTPYLVNELSLQPRFKGESVVLVAMRDEKIQAESDELTEGIRTRLMDALLQSSGINLVPLNTDSIARGWEGHLQNHACYGAGSAQYYVGIDLQKMPSGKARLQIRALDASSSRWVTGFGRIWQGQLSHNQWNALDTRKIADNPRGHRDLPFLETETDLLAAHMAGKIRCALAGQVPLRGIEISEAEKSPSVLQQVLELVSRNLSRQQMIPAVTSGTIENMQLAGTLNRIDGDLHQIWIDVSVNTDGNAARNIATDAYISVSSTQSRFTASGTTEHPSVNSVSTGMPDMSAPSVIEQTDHRRFGSVLSQLQVVRGRAIGDCAIGYNNKNRLDRHRQPPDCYDLEFEVYEPAYVMLVRHETSGLLSRVPLEGCDTLQSMPGRLTPASRVHIGGLRYKDPAWTSGESVYAMAVTSNKVEQEIARHISRLPNDCDIPPFPVEIEDDRHWMEQLDSIIARHRGSVEWRSLEIRL